MSTKISLVQGLGPSKLNWNINGFENFELYKHVSPGDGHCLVHSIANAFYKGYREGMVNGRSKSRYEIVSELRHNIAIWLEKTDPKTGNLNYDLISGGNLKIFGKESPEFSLEGLKTLLRSSESLGQQSVSIFELALEKRIFILDSNTYDVYKFGHFNMDDKLKSIVIYYSHNDNLNTGHFDMISCFRRDTGKHATHFNPEHPFIVFLMERMNR